MQEEGLCLTHILQTVRLSRILRPEHGTNLEETVPLRRAVTWVLVWIGLFIGIALYFKYARLLTPLLG